MNTKLYRRSIDAGHGTQNLLFVNGECVSQYLTAPHGRYTGDGNPGFLGQTPRQIGMKVNGFKRVRGYALGIAESEYFQRDVA